MNTLLNALKDNTNFTRTENGALTHKTTKSDLLDMFAMGGAYRKRSNEDVILLFKKAYEENPVYALKCLFYLRDIRGRQGERRFFRVCIKWLANNDIDAMRRNLQYVPMFGRYDDLYEFVGTKLEKDAFQMQKLCHFLDRDVPLLLGEAVDTADQLQVFFYGKPRSDGCLLGRDPKEGFHLVGLRGNAFPHKQRIPCGGLGKAGKHFDGGGLSRAVDPQQGEQLPFFDGKGQGIHRHHVAVAFCQVTDLNRRHALPPLYALRRHPCIRR